MAKEALISTWSQTYAVKDVTDDAVTYKNMKNEDVVTLEGATKIWSARVSASPLGTMVADQAAALRRADELKRGRGGDTAVEGSELALELTAAHGHTILEVSKVEGTGELKREFGNIIGSVVYSWEHM